MIGQELKVVRTKTNGEPRVYSRLYWSHVDSECIKFAKSFFEKLIEK